MKIKFFDVTGNVAIDDRYSTQQATAGLVLDTSGRPYVIMVGDHSSAVLVIESRTLTLPANAFLYTPWTNPGRTHGLPGDLRLLIGRIWSKIDSGTLREDTIGNAVVGVRG
jgi:hypothetical protein